MDRDSIKKALGSTFSGLSRSDIDSAGLPESAFISGKVRDIINLGDDLVIAASDRISAFDRILTTIPYKGEILNKMALFWFDQTKDIIPNHIRKVVTPRTVRVTRCEVLPVEVIVRAYITGSAWRDYLNGKAVSGITLPPGMKMNQRLESPIITPSTKAEQGLHDEPISEEEILKGNLVDPAVWNTVRTASLELFRRGTEIAAENGLILVDTKYEFGLLNGEVYIVDEIHTPDSSRFWYADTYESLFASGEKQRKVDKEYLRQWLMEQGFMGEGDPPDFPDEVRVETSWKYIQAYETVTGKQFVPESENPEAEIQKISNELGNAK